ncbi:MAG: RnfABCDGE type electron transport complex subunit D [Lentisphaeria bacterium]|nr:RnfABCDGE type electron transport complex subunit D [Lentisphaeria bacterium]
MPGLIVSSSPHFHTHDTVESIMRWVIIALLPACLAGIYFFGLGALRVLAICTVASLAFEYLSAKAMGKSNELKDGSAAVTGLLLGMNLPSSTPWWICVIGCFMAIVVGKMIYGGLGCNPFNPALVGRVALLLAFPVVMTTWPMPRVPQCLANDAPIVATTSATPAQSDDPADAALMPTTTATPLKYSKLARTNKTAATLLEDCTPANQKPFINYWQMFLGIGKGGSLGETCGLALLIGGVLLVMLNIVRWQIPVFYLATMTIITGIAWIAAPESYANPVFHLLSGGVLLGAFFMATDMVTTPLSRTGAIVFGIGCGILTACIRLWGSYPEGVSFSILIMNAFTPLIDRFTAGKPFGMPKKKGIAMPKA